ncbi:tetraspanin-36-like [Gigantopelta aegis]|uniref:tetraspanin-36-like n=1 Tax=Gigantopelta aegis TaxID=1735272 RepID=UPI001B88D0FD|nr:tetraspanin-36-like [Gigantopelta aegis]
MTSACAVSSKIFLLVVSLLFWAAAVGLCFVGSWVYSTYSHFEELTDASLTLLPASIMIAVGIFMFIIGLLGCVAACKENKCLLATFFSLILIVFLGEVIGGVMGYVYRDDVRQTVSDDLWGAVNRYNESTYQHQVDYVQEQLHCCGVNNASDWLDSKVWSGGHPNSVPKSCCINQTNLTICDNQLNSTNHDIYTEGCLDSLKDKFLKNLIYIASVSISFAVIQILGLLSVCVLLCRSREVRYETLTNAQRDGLRV